MKYVLIGIIALLSIGLGVVFFLQNEFTTGPSTPADTVDMAEENGTSPTDDDADETTVDMDTDPDTTPRPAQEQIGTSAGGNPIIAHYFGDGPEMVLFVGGMHGGYSYNTSLLAFALIDHLNEQPDTVPENLTIAVVPSLNADGFVATVGSIDRFTAAQMPTPLTARVDSRFNSNDVDLNRNFACQWQAESTWQNQTVSAGNAAFSEPETQAIRSLADNNNMRAVVAWFSAEGAVYGSACGAAEVAETQTLARSYGQAAGYTVHDRFTAYTITGDMLDWFATQNVPAFSVLLSDHTSTDWSQNRLGIEALLSELSE